MADYFTNFSLIMPLPTEAAQQYAIEIAERACVLQLANEPVPADLPTSLRAVLEDWWFETEPHRAPEGWGVWLHSSSGGIDAACVFIQHLLQRFNAAGHASLEWSHDCSKPRTDAYGGGAALITARKIKTINTGEWLHRQVARLPKPQPAGAP